jgi:hypothetical protein
MAIRQISDFTNRDQEILKSYKCDITDWCGHKLAVEVTANRLGVSQAQVESVVRRLFEASSII